MRRLLLVLSTVAIAVASASPRQGDGVVRGVVRELRSAEPIAGAQITLTAVAPAALPAVPAIRLVGVGDTPPEVVESLNEELAAARGQPGTPALTAIADSNGRFEISNIPAGSYTFRRGMTPL